MARSGVNFRSTSGYVSDGSGETYQLADIYPTTRGGLTFGYVSTTGVNPRDRNSGINRRIAGMHFISTGTPEWKLDLPNGAGTYNVWVLLGDNDAGWAHTCVIKDGGTTKATITASTATARWLDANGTNSRTAANIAADTFDPVSVTFSGTTASFVLGNGSGNNSTIAHIAVELSGGGGSSIAPISMNFNRLRRA
jgi:hypothetical protein